MKDTLKNHSVKIQIGTAVVVVFAVAGMAWRASERFSSIEARDVSLEAKIEVIEAQGERNKEHITTLETKANEADLDRTKILVKLENIEVTLLELKQSLIQHDSN